MNFFDTFHFNKQNYSIVIWSEACHYWSTFEPLVKYFQKNKVKFVYLASDENDIGLNECKDSLHIGNGWGSFKFLNNIKADILISTTPNLGDSAFKRSKKVKHYIHIVHAPMDIHLYRRVGFECFDTVMCAGQHQIDTIRKLEKVRGTEKKNLIKTGCLYYDNMKPVKNIAKSKNKTILIAPSWGKNNILKIADKFIPEILKSNYNVIIRPHPQSLKHEKALLDNIKSKYSKIEWDFNSDNSHSLSKSDLMIGDISGVLFDYIAIHNKPIIIIDRKIKFDYAEMSDIPKDIPWEIKNKINLGTTIKSNDLNSISKYINKAFKKKVNADKIKKQMFNFGKAGNVAGKQIMQILKGLK